jgi:hypothetical protein
MTVGFFLQRILGFNCRTLRKNSPILELWKANNPVLAAALLRQFCQEAILSF